MTVNMSTVREEPRRGRALCLGNMLLFMILSRPELQTEIALCLKMRLSGSADMLVSPR